MYQRATVFPIIFSFILELVVFFEKIIMFLSVSIATRRVSYDCVREISNYVENVTRFVEQFVVIRFIKQYYKRNTKFMHILLKEHTSILFHYKTYLIKEQFIYPISL